MRWVDGIIDSMDMSLSKLREIVKDREVDVVQSMRSQRLSVGHVQLLATPRTAAHEVSLSLTIS